MEAKISMKISTLKFTLSLCIAALAMLAVNSKVLANCYISNTGVCDFVNPWRCNLANGELWCCETETQAKTENKECTNYTNITPSPPLGATSTPSQNQPTPTTTPATIFPAPNNQTFTDLNPLHIGGADNIANKAASDYETELSTPGGIVSRVIKFLFPLAGLVLFVMLVWGGFEIMMGSISKKVDAGKQRVMAAIVGFLILFATYWIWQIIQVVFGVKVL